MSDKTMTFEVDLVPNTTETLNLGSSSKKWKINGVTPGSALEKNVDSSISSASSTNLPTSAAVASYVADAKEIKEYTDYSSFPLTGAAGNIYVDKTTNNMYRWSGSAYVSLSTDPTAITNTQIDNLFT